MSTPSAEENMSASRQVVALHLGQEVYGIDIAAIHTVIVPQDITPVPKVPNFVRGVMNLRGQIIPVIDLRVRFDLPPISTENYDVSRIVIVDTDGLKAGMIVDAVSEVLTLSENAIEAPSGLIASTDSDFITGIGRIATSGEKAGNKERLILLLDLLKVLTPTPEDYTKLKKLKRAA